jgi:hypothetical protein
MAVTKLNCFFFEIFFTSLFRELFSKPERKLKI